MYKDDLALNNVQWLICYKTNPKQTYFWVFFAYGFIVYVI